MAGTPPTRIPCTFLLPLAYNDGQPVEEDRRERFFDRLFVEFGGYRIAGEERGAYRRQDDGQKQVEVMLRVIVAVSGTEGVARLREMVAQIGGELDQECMYFEVSSGSAVELVPSSKKGGR